MAAVPRVLTLATVEHWIGAEETGLSHYGRLTTAPALAFVPASWAVFPATWTVRNFAVASTVPRGLGLVAFRCESVGASTGCLPSYDHRTGMTGKEASELTALAAISRGPLRIRAGRILLQPTTVPGRTGYLPLWQHLGRPSG